MALEEKAFHVQLTRGLPLEPRHDQRVRAPADVAEAAAGRGKAAEGAERRYVVRAVRIAKIDVLVRVVDIPPDRESDALVDFPGLRQGGLRPDDTRTGECVAA